MYSLITSILFAASAVGSAIPHKLQSRDVSADDLSRFKFWVQYAAAADCHSNYAGQSGADLTCSAGNCPQVQAAAATIIYDFADSTPTDTTGFVARDDTNKAIVLSFRGSHSIRNWISDIEFPYTYPGLCDGCFAEFGFWSSWDVVRAPITKIINETVAANPDYELVITGHSLGAAVATLAAADLRGKGYSGASLYAFASPRVGNPALAKYITAQGKNYRFTHTEDPVPKLPLIAMGYVHVSPEYWITSPNNVTVSTSDIQVLEGEINRNGNTGNDIPDLSKVDDHHWYFERTDDCLASGTPFRV